MSSAPAALEERHEIQLQSRLRERGVGQKPRAARNEGVLVEPRGRERRREPERTERREQGGRKRSK
eukprot:2558775-Heterocapsa_arctica.AAC.1